MNEQIYEEASEWVVRNRNEALDVASRAQFDQWLRRSPENIQAYLELSSVWESLPEVVSEAEGQADSLATLLQATSPAVVPLRPPRRGDVASRGTPRLEAAGTIVPSIRWRFLSAVAAAAVVIVSGAWLYVGRDSYETGVGEQRSLVLEDGSRIELNALSRVRVRYSASGRRVELLKGQALFDVARNPARPFVVRTGDTYLRAVGTQFDVYRKAQATVVTVVEGKVAVSPALASAPASEGGGARARVPQDMSVVRQPEVLVGAGEQMTVRPSADSRPQPANVEAALAWRRRTVFFDSSPLSQVAAEFNRYNKRPIVVEGAVPDTLRISGVFSTSDPTVLLSFLRTQPDLSIDVTDEEIRISAP